MAIVQQRFDSINKLTYWTSIDPWLADELYLHKNFSNFFDERSGPPTDGIYPTVTVRQIMLGLKMKPIKRECWETYFDRRLIRFAEITLCIMEGVIVMILFTILLTVIIAIAVITAILSIVCAGSFVLAFGDLIVFGLIVWMIIKLIKKSKK